MKHAVVVPLLRKRQATTSREDGKDEVAREAEPEGATIPSTSSYKWEAEVAAIPSMSSYKWEAEVSTSTFMVSFQ